MDYRDIGHLHRGVFDAGKLKIQSEGFFFKSAKTGKAFQVPATELDSLEWMRVARGYEVKVITKDGNITKFEGFKESDYADLKKFSRTSFNKELHEVDLCAKGWNWGEPKFRGSLMSFMVDSKPAFEIPLKEVSQVTSNKNEVILEFHQSEEAPLSLVEMRFHIPSTTAATNSGEPIEDQQLEEDSEENPVKVFHNKVLAKADVIQATGDAIATFEEIHSLTPRGRYSIKAYPTFLQLHGKTFDYKIPYTSITRLFLLPHNDQRQMFFVVGLDPPIRQGQTRYYFVIFLLPTDDNCDVTLSLTDEELQERYEGKLTRDMSGSFYEVFSRVMRVLVGKKITVPGTFKSNNNQCAIACSCRATSGYLYPLDKGFIFVHKPAVYIKFEGIASVNFARMTAGAGVSRSFDFEIELKDGNTHHFSSLMKEDYTRLFEFVAEKNIRVKNKGKVPVQTVSYNDDVSSDSDHDAYLERMKAEGEERDSEDDDSDFVAGASGSDDELEYDSEAKISDDDQESDQESKVQEQQKVKKRKKDTSKVARSPKKAKTKESTSGGRKKKPKKDPNAPKKPLSAYMLWLQDNRPMFKQKYPGISVTEIGKKAGEMWKQMSKEDKKEYEDKAVAAKKRYEIAMKEYKASGAAAAFAASSSSSHTPAKSKKSPAKRAQSTAKSSSSKQYKSAEYVPSDADSSGEESEPAKSSTRSKGDGGLVSLPSGDEGSEEDAEMTSGSEESESD